MADGSDLVQTCAESLLNAGVCCFERCNHRAEWALLDGDLVEHATCPAHNVFPEPMVVLARKRLVFGEIFGPTALPDDD